MRFGFSTFFFPHKPLVKLIDEIVGHGVTAVELVYDIPHIHQFDERLVAHLRRLGREGIYFSLHCPFLEVNLSGYFEEVRSFSREMTERAIKFAGRAGCNPVVIHPGYTFMGSRVESIEHEARSHMIEALTSMASLGEDFGITLGLENLQMPFFLLHHLKDFAPFKHVIPGLGLVLDIGHAYIIKRRECAADPEGSILGDLEAIGVENVIHVHVSNNSGTSDEHGLIEGDIDLKRVLQWLHDRGYRGRAIIESTEMEKFGMAAVLEKIREIEPQG